MAVKAGHQGKAGGYQRFKDSDLKERKTIGIMDQLGAWSLKS